MKIISASRRTDIPAFYTPWLLNRLEAGYCHVVHPFSGKVRRVELSPDSTLALVLWSRHPRPLLPHLSGILDRGYAPCLYMTILGGNSWLERWNPPRDVQLRDFGAVSRLLSPARTRWRYDPIVLSDATPPEFHLHRFRELARSLEGFTDRCTFSFVDFYGKTARNLRRVEAESGIRIHEPTTEEKERLTRRMAAVATEHGIALHSCCDDRLVGDGVKRSRCIDPTLVSLPPGRRRELRPAPTRKECGCVESVDIGAYDTCPFGCAYCYATNSRSAALRRKARHDPRDTLLWRPRTLESTALG